ncbi:MAG: YegS/Rv2252/BmrU family lipid kinase [Bulleidia sp.]|nr:YegS/Rv2252/BmrU family lipid kinase [Bulleidia sp.]
MKKVLLLVNFHAGTGMMKENLPEMLEVLSAHGCECTVYPIPNPNMTTHEIIAGAKGRFDVIACAGGDGTLNHMISAMIENDVDAAMGYIPSGSTNDFSRSIDGGRKLSISEQCLAIAEGKPFVYDIGSFNERYFNYVAAFGALTSVSYNTSQDLKNLMGYGAYMLNALASVPDGLRTRIHGDVAIDGKRVSGDYIFGGVCNTNSVGGVATPWLSRAELNDGLFEVVLIDAPANILELNEALTDLRSGNRESTHVHFYQGSDISMHMDQKIVWTLDGEEGSAVDNVEIKVLHNAVKLMVPLDV